MNHDILSYYTKKDVDNLVADLELEANGYSLYYIFDTFDIVDYFFPVKRKNNDFLEYDSSLNKFLTNNPYDKYLRRYNDNVFQIFSTYNYFFNKDDDKSKGYGKPPILPDEYIVELMNFRDTIVGRKINFRRIEKKFKLFVKEIEEKDFSDQFKVIKYTENRIDLLSTFFSSIYSQKNLNNFDEFLTKRLLIQKFESGSANDELIDKLWLNAFKSDLTNEIFGAFCEKYGKFLNEKSVNDKFSYLENIYRDIVVIDRVIQVNKKIQKENLKHIFYYVSSTPFRANRIFEIIDENNSLPQIDNYKSFNLKRDVYDLFLKKVVYSLSGETNNQVEIGEEIKKVILDESDLEESLKSYTNSLKDLKDNQLAISDLTRKDLIGKLNLRQLELFVENNNLKSKLEKEFKSFSSNESPVTFINQLNSLFDVDVFEKLADIKINEHHLSYMFNRSLLKLVEDPSLITTKLPSIDAVSSSYHHLPLLLFYKKSNISKEQSLLLKDLCAYYLINKNSSNIDHVKKTVELVKQFEGEAKKTTSIESNLLRLFVFLTISDDSNREDLLKREKNILYTAEQLLGIAKETYHKTPLPKKYNLEEEIYYFIIWVARRVLAFDKAISYSTEAIKKFSSSARIYHSIGLVYISMYYEQFFKKEDFLKGEDHCHKSLEYLSKAENYYLKDLLRTKGDVKLKIRKILVSIYNTKCDINIKLYNITRDIICLESAKVFFEKAINEDKEINGIFIDSAVMLHTQADLLYIESWNNYYSLKKSKEAKNIIEKSQKLLLEAEKKYGELSASFEFLVSRKLINILDSSINPSEV